MQKETLAAANVLCDKIDMYEHHLTTVKLLLDSPEIEGTEPVRRLYRVKEDLPLTLYYFKSSYAEQFHLKPEFLNMREFLLVYKARIEDALKKLKAELEAL